MFIFIKYLGYNGERNKQKRTNEQTNEQTNKRTNTPAAESLFPSATYEFIFLFIRENKLVRFVRHIKLIKTWLLT